MTDPEHSLTKGLPSKAQLFEEAREHQQAGDPIAAMEIYKRIAERFPTSAQAHAETARLLAAEWQRSSAFQAWLKALQVAGSRAPRSWWEEALGIAEVTDERADLIDLARLLGVIPRFGLSTPADYVDGALSTSSGLGQLLALATGEAGLDVAQINASEHGDNIRIDLTLSTELQGGWGGIRQQLNNYWQGNILHETSRPLIDVLLNEPRDSWDRGIPQIVLWLVGLEATDRWPEACSMAGGAILECESSTLDVPLAVRMIISGRDEGSTELLDHAWDDISIHLLTLVLRWSPRSGSLAFQAESTWVDRSLAAAPESEDQERRRQVLSAVLSPSALHGTRALTTNQQVRQPHRKRTSSLRVAVCISGQLRGFREAAATALRHSLVVATRNEKDFNHTGLKTKNPFNA